MEVPAELKGLALYEGRPELIKEWPMLIEAWRLKYPSLDIAAEITSAHLWELENRSKRKADGEPTIHFLGNWLRRAEAKRAAQPARNGGGQGGGRLGEAIAREKAMIAELFRKANTPEALALAAEQKRVDELPWDEKLQYMQRRYKEDPQWDGKVTMIEAFSSTTSPNGGPAPSAEKSGPKG